MSDRSSSISRGSSSKNSPSSISRHSFLQLEREENELLLSASGNSHDDSWKSGSESGSQNVPLFRSQFSSSRLRLSPTKKCLEIAALILVGAGIIAIMFVPIMTVHFNQPGLPKPTNCSESESWVTLDNSCTVPVKYSGVCLEQLRHLQMCATNRTANDEVFVNVSNLTELENEAKKFINYIKTVPNTGDGCKQAVVPFLCQYLFPLCNVTNNTSQGDLIVPSQEECNNLREKTCEAEWQVAKILGYGHLLPDCNKSKAVFPTVTSCAEGFALSNGSCFPTCDWKQIAEPWLTILNVIQLFSALLAVISSLVLFMVSVIRYRSMFRYPSIYLVFMTLGFFVVGVLALVGRASPELLCNAETSLLRKNSTFYCILAGAAFQYFVVGSTIWWFFHVCSIFLKMTVFVTPVYKKLELKIHIGLTVFGFIAPLPTVLNVIVQNSLSYEVQYFPVLLLCQPSDINYWFLTTILPIDILCGIGLALLIAIVWLLHKYQSLLRATPQGSKLQLSTPEIKLLIVFFFYALFGIWVLFYSIIATEINGSSLLAGIIQYFTCEIHANSTEACSEDYSKIGTLSFPYLLAILLLLLGCVPMVNLMFAINWKFLKAKLLYFWEHLQWYCSKQGKKGLLQHQTNKPYSCLNCKTVPKT